VYGAAPVVQRAREFLGHSDHRLQIVVENLTVSSSHPLIEELGDEANFEIYRLDPELAEMTAFHFSTADGDCFRFEREKNSHSAIAAFGDEQTTEHLNRMFVELLANSEEIDRKELLH
jgi:hypothetical protein